MPYVNIKVTREGTSPGASSTTPEQKAALIQGVSELLLQVLGKPLNSTMVVIDEVELENWGVGGLPVPEYRRQLAASEGQRPKPVETARSGKWRDNPITRLFDIELPIIQAPMAGATTKEMVIAVSEAGGLGSLPGALYSTEQLRAVLQEIRTATQKPINVNFFTHTAPAPDPERQMAWQKKLAPYYAELGLDAAQPISGAGRKAFDEETCAVIEELRPQVVSFHFGLPKAELLERVKRTGARVISSATTVAEARWLVERGVDAVIAMGLEAGGHRGSFLSDDMSTQVGTMALVPQIVDAVNVPVIAAGGIGDRRGVRAAFALGASAVQVGTAFLLTPEAGIPVFHRDALQHAHDDGTAVTNVFTGRPARGFVNRLMREIGPLSKDAPAFPTAGAALAPLRAVLEKQGKTDFTNMWAGQAAALVQPMSAAELTRHLADIE